MLMGETGRMAYLDYHRTVIGYHGTTANVADDLVAGEPFVPSESVDEWLGNGVYFWEYPRSRLGGGQRISRSTQIQQLSGQ